MRRAMGQIPEPAANIAHDISNHSGRNNKYQGIQKCERINAVFKTQEMQTKNPIQIQLGYPN